MELDQISERGGYLYIKIADGRKNKNWYPLGRKIWEQENGKLPDDCRIAFLDGNPCNVDISNLAAVPINEFAIAAVNIGMVKGDPELNSAILAAAKLKAAIRRKQNEG